MEALGSQEGVRGCEDRREGVHDSNEGGTSEAASSIWETCGQGVPPFAEWEIPEVAIPNGKHRHHSQSQQKIASTQALGSLEKHSG